MTNTTTDTYTKHGIILRLASITGLIQIIEQPVGTDAGVPPLFPVQHRQLYDGSDFGYSVADIQGQYKDMESGKFAQDMLDMKRGNYETEEEAEEDVLPDEIYEEEKIPFADLEADKRYEPE